MNKSVFKGMSSDLKICYMYCKFVNGVFCVTIDLYLFQESWCQTSLGVTFHSVGRVSLHTFRQTESLNWIVIGRPISWDLSLRYMHTVCDIVINIFDK